MPFSVTSFGLLNNSRWSVQPAAHRSVSLPDQGVDGLQTNFYVNKLLDFAAVKKGTSVPCQVCEGKEGGARSWCVQCAVLLCESCTNTHRRFPDMRRHQIVAQLLQKNEECVAGSFQRKVFCSKHEDQVLTFYCEPCQTLVCVSCAVVDHRQDNEHNLVEIGDVAERKKLDLQDLLKKVDHRTRESQAALNDFEKDISELTTSTDATIEQATVCSDHLITLLQDRKKEIVNDIELGRQEVMKYLETQKEAIEFELAGLTSASEFCTQALEHGSDVNVIVVEGQARQRVEELLTTPTDLQTPPSQVVFSEGTAVADNVKVTLDDPLGQPVPTRLQEKNKGLGSHGIIRVYYSREGTLLKTLNSDCFRDLRGVRVLKDDCMLVVDKKLKCCLLLQPDGSLIRDIGKGQLQNPRFVAVDESRDLFYVTDGDAHKVLVFDLEGKMKFKFGEVGLGERQFLCPSGITLDPTGNVIVVNFLGGRLQVFGPDGTYLRTVPRESQRQQMVT
ncbi:E3 ubiquitin-protein ligase TRIM56-like [Branchiostoma floridae x Branchiostoma japonicum]